MKVLAAILFWFVSLAQLSAQSADEQLLKAGSLLKQFKETEALEAYKQVLLADPNNITALVKCTELCSSIGKKQVDKVTRDTYYTASKAYADKALAGNSGNADAYYAESLAYANLSQTDEENKKVIEYVKGIKVYADKGLSLNPKHGLLNYMEGKWHYAMLDLNWFKKAAIKTLYANGLAKPDLDSAIFYMERCRIQEPYFVQNYSDLAKAYRMKSRPVQEMEILTKLVKLPNRTADDASLKAEGKKRLQELE